MAISLASENLAITLASGYMGIYQGIRRHGGPYLWHQRILRLLWHLDILGYIKASEDMEGHIFGIRESCDYSGIWIYGDISRHQKTWRAISLASENLAITLASGYTGIYQGIRRHGGPYLWHQRILRLLWHLDIWGYIKASEDMEGHIFGIRESCDYSGIWIYWDISRHQKTWMAISLASENLAITLASGYMGIYQGIRRHGGPYLWHQRILRLLWHLDIWGYIKASEDMDGHIFGIRESYDYSGIWIYGDISRHQKTWMAISLASENLTITLASGYMGIYQGIRRHGWPYLWHQRILRLLWHLDIWGYIKASEDMDGHIFGIRESYDYSGIWIYGDISRHQKTWMAISLASENLTITLASGYMGIYQGIRRHGWPYLWHQRILRLLWHLDIWGYIKASEDMDGHIFGIRESYDYSGIWIYGDISQASEDMDGHIFGIRESYDYSGIWIYGDISRHQKTWMAISLASENLTITLASGYMGYIKASEDMDGHIFGIRESYDYSGIWIYGDISRHQKTWMAISLASENLTITLASGYMGIYQGIRRHGWPYLWHQRILRLLWHLDIWGYIKASEDMDGHIFGIRESYDYSGIWIYGDISQASEDMDGHIFGIRESFDYSGIWICHRHQGNIVQYLTRHGIINYGRYTRTTKISRFLVRSERKVIVIGAGAAGISAATQLTSFGFDVIILEARARIGGRIQSFKTKRGNIIETGADTLRHVECSPMAALLTQVGPQGQQQAMLDEHAVFDFTTIFSDGKPLNEDKINMFLRHYDASKGALQFQSHQKEHRDENGRWISRQQAYENIINMCERGTLIKYYNHTKQLEEVARAKELHFKQMKVARNTAIMAENRLKRMEGKDEAEIDPLLRRSLKRDIVTALDKFEEISNAYEAAESSWQLLSSTPQAKQFMHPGSDFSTYNFMLGFEEYLIGAQLEKVQFSADSAVNKSLGVSTRISQGLHALLLHQVRNRNMEILLNNRVMDIDYSRENSVKLTVKNEKDEIVEMDAAFVVCTLPIGVLKKTIINDERAPTFTPRLHPKKIQAIRRMGSGLVNKCILEFEKAFWTTATSSRASQFVTVSPNVKTRGCLSIWSSTPKSTVLTTYIIGENADHELPDEVIIQNAMTILQKTFGNQCPRSPVSAHVTRWQNDELAFGSGSYMSLLTEKSDFDELMRPLETKDGKNRVYFAGEHTSLAYNSTVQGAWISGARAAAELTNEHIGIGFVDMAAIERAEKGEEDLEDDQDENAIIEVDRDGPMRQEDYEQLERMEIEAQMQLHEALAAIEAVQSAGEAVRRGTGEPIEGFRRGPRTPDSQRVFGAVNRASNVPSEAMDTSENVPEAPEATENAPESSENVQSAPEALEAVENAPEAPQAQENAPEAILDASEAQMDAPEASQAQEAEIDSPEASQAPQALEDTPEAAEPAPEDVQGPSEEPQAKKAKIEEEEDSSKA
ncbi:hypothetical protein B9Z55_003738 [Caenorhabditis nigoni]|nr:hypothetical protein B9Z55_003738 [Caenorhabditis nigoni]